MRLEIERAADRQEGFVRVREVLARFEDSPERQDAIRYAADKLDLPKETQQGLAPRATSSSTGQVSPRLLDAGDRLERNALAGVAAHRSLVPVLAELGPEHFDSEQYRRVREGLVSGGEQDATSSAWWPSSSPCRVGGNRRADRRAAVAPSARAQDPAELIDADPARTLELQTALERIHATVEELAAAQAFSR